MPPVRAFASTVLPNATAMTVAGGKPVPWTVILVVGGPEGQDRVIVCAHRLRVSRKKGTNPLRIDDRDLVILRSRGGKREVSHEVIGYECNRWLAYRPGSYSSLHQSRRGA